MYATAHLVRDASGHQALNVYVYRHGPEFIWPPDPWALPERAPGERIITREELPAGGNRVVAYLDVLMPDDTAPADVDAALTALWLEFTADEAGPSTMSKPVPNPVIYQHGPVVLRFAVEADDLTNRAFTLAVLRRALRPLQPNIAGGPLRAAIR